MYKKREISLWGVFALCAVVVLAKYLLKTDQQEFEHEHSKKTDIFGL